MQTIFSSGKRKRAIAKARIIPGNGKMFFNKKNYEGLPLFDNLKLQEPLKIAEQILGKIEFDAFLTVRGGGEKGQIDAARLALARGIVDYTKSKDLEKAYLEYDRNLIVADVRRKEACKPGDSKARAKRQSSKR